MGGVAAYLASLVGSPVHAPTASFRPLLPAPVDELVDECPNSRGRRPSSDHHADVRPADLGESRNLADAQAPLMQESLDRPPPEALDIARRLVFTTATP